MEREYAFREVPFLEASLVLERPPVAVFWASPLSTFRASSWPGFFLSLFQWRFKSLLVSCRGSDARFSLGFFWCVSPPNDLEKMDPPPWHASAFVGFKGDTDETLGRSI